MADDPQGYSPAARPARQRQPGHELRYWSQKFGVSPEQLKKVVGRVGPMADDVERAISGSKAET